MALKLSGAQRTVNKLMSDTCTIRRQEDRYSAGTIDPTTLKLSKDPGTQVYDGKCFVTPLALQAGGQDVGGNAASQKQYQISIPIDSPELRPGDDVTMKTSVDAQLVGRTFRLQDVVVSSVPVWRQATMVGLETSRG